MKTLAIIGGGPAALMLAAEIDNKKYNVTIFEKKKAVGRKFLVAGEGGLNLTYSSSVSELIKQYSPSDFMAPIIKQFSNTDLINWLNDHNIPTFIGSSNRVFPDLELKPIEVLNKIVQHVAANSVNFKFNKTWTGWSNEGHLCFEDSEFFEADITVFALGGASWKVTGSDGVWAKTFTNQGINTLPFRAVNCAFEVNWPKNFIASHEGKPLKNIALSYSGSTIKGELVISKFGLEGNAIYALSQKIQHTLLDQKSCTIQLDLKPTMTIDQLTAKYKNSKSVKVSDILSKDLNLDRTSISLLKQFTNKETFSSPALLMNKIKSLPIELFSADNIDSAISTIGGIDLKEIDNNFQLKKMPNTYAIGEMLDWYAPTGGYLLQGCFSMGIALAKYLNEIKK